MVDRIPSGFNPFVIPFLAGMAFVFSYCIFGIVRILLQLCPDERKRFLLSLLNPSAAARNLRDILCDCLLHVRLWKRSPLLGYMHSSIAFGWFMLILLGHLEVLLFVPGRINLFYYPIFFNYFVAEVDETLKGALLFFLMDFFLLVVLSGITLAVIKRFRSRWFGMRRTTRHSITDLVGMYALWAIFPLRLLAETFTAHISGGSFLTRPANWLFRNFLGNELNLEPTWWAYSIALCIFMCVLPFSRYMHIPAEMMLIPLRNAGIRISSARKGFTRVQVLSCPGCGVCIDACPLTADKRNVRDCTVYLNRAIRRGDEARIGQISDKCLLCGKCTALCQVGADGPQLRLSQRSARSYKLAPDWSLLDSSASAPLSQEDASGARTLYFSGCMSQLVPSVGKSMESLFRKAGVDYVWMDRDGGLCCGRPLFTAGRVKEAEELVHRNEELILSFRADTLVVSCPICYRMFTEKYVLPGVRVVHYSRYIEGLVQLGRLRVEKSSICYVYHDPCELGRGCGIYEEPRKLLSRAATLSEALVSRRESICCGGSLGSLSLDFSAREKISRAALDNLYESKADAIATACPLCQATLSRYADRPVHDLANIIDNNSEKIIDYPSSVQLSVVMQQGHGSASLCRTRITSKIINR